MDTPLPGIQLFQMMTGFAVSQAIYAAARLNIAEHLGAGPAAIDDLAKKTGADPDALYRLLRALASVGVFTEPTARRFANTPMSECLRPGVPGSMHAGALMIGNLCYPAFCELPYSVQTGRPGFDKGFGMPLFDYLAKNPEEGKLFDAAMTSIHGPETPAMIEAYDFGAFKTMLSAGDGFMSMAGRAGWI